MCAFAVHRQFLTWEPDRDAARGESSSESSFSSAAAASFLEACRPPARTMPRRMPWPLRLPNNDSRKRWWVASWGRICRKLLWLRYATRAPPYRCPSRVTTETPVGLPTGRSTTAAVSRQSQPDARGKVGGGGLGYWRRGFLGPDRVLQHRLQPVAAAAEEGAERHFGACTVQDGGCRM